MGLIDRMDGLIDRIGQRFDSLMEANGQPSTGWGAMSGQGGQSRGSWLGLSQPQAQQTNSLSWRYLGSPSANYPSSDVSLMGLGPGFSNYDWGSPAKKEAAKKEADRPLPIGSTVTGGGTPGQGFGNPDLAAIEKQLGARGTRNTAIKAETIAKYATQYGVPVSVALAILNQESGYGTDPNSLSDGNNYFGLTGTGDAGSRVVTYPNGKSWTFAMFSTPEAGIEAAIKNMAGEQYHNLTLRQYLALYLTGDVNGADDGVGNQTDVYVNNALAIIQAMGGNANPNSIVVGPRAQQSAQPGYSGGPGLTSIWGGRDVAISQAYGVVDPSINQDIYRYGQSYGLPQGHPGIDVAMKRGDPIYMPAGMTGTVITAGGTPYFRDEDYGDQGTPGKGELRVRLANGDEIIFGHTSAINVPVGAQVTGGMVIAAVGSANRDHLHLEVRQRQADGSYRLVDPVAYFGGQTGGGGTSYR